MVAEARNTPNWSWLWGQQSREPPIDCPLATAPGGEIATWSLPGWSSWSKLLPASTQWRAATATKTVEVYIWRRDERVGTNWPPSLFLLHGTWILQGFTCWLSNCQTYQVLAVRLGLSNCQRNMAHQCNCKDRQTILWDSLALAPIHSFQCDGITQWWCFTLICLVLSRIPCGHCQPPILMVCPQDCIVVAFVICKFIRQQISMVQWKTLAQRHCTCWSICCNSSSCRVGNCPRGQVLWRMKELLI